MCRSRAHLVQLIKSCGNARDLPQGRKLHQEILRSNQQQQDTFLENKLVDMYSKCGSLGEARQVFKGIRQPNIFSWNIIVAAYAHNGQLEQARELFESMPQHSLVSWNLMVASYTKTGLLDSASELFGRMPYRDSVSCTAMLCAYAQAGNLRGAKLAFDSIPTSKDLVSWTAMLHAYSHNGFSDEARLAFDRMPQHDLVSWHIGAFAESGDLGLTLHRFESLPQRDVVSWTVLVTSYLDQDRVVEARRVFDLMPQWDVIASSALVQVYAQSGDLDHAAWIFNRMENKVESCWTNMLAAYAQDGQLVKAKEIFDSMSNRDVVSWTAMVQAYSQAGHLDGAVSMLEEMTLAGVLPNEVTFLAILAGCSHSGAYKDGLRHFQSMVSSFYLQPGIEHYRCVVDSLGRAKLLDEAEELVENMPFGPDVLTWSTLLASCKVHGDVDLGAKVASKAVQLSDQSRASYLLVSNLLYMTSKEQVQAARSTFDKAPTEKLLSNLPLLDYC